MPVFFPELTVAVEALIRITAWLILAALVAAALWRASAANRRLVWILAFCGLPLIVALHHAPRWQVIPARWTSHTPAEITQAASAMPRFVHAVSIGSQEVVPSGMQATAPARAISPVTVWGQLSSALLWLNILWAMVTLLLLIRTAHGHLRVRKLRREATPLPAEISQPLAQATEILSSPQVPGPMTVGVLRPAILLPSESLHWPPTRLQAVLHHELEHVRARDGAIQLLAQTLCAIFWFHPLVWYARGRLRVERELAADNAVLEKGVSAPDYAKELIVFARATRKMAALGLGSLPFERRIGHLLGVRNRRANSTMLRLAGIITAMLFGIGVACVGEVPDQAPATSAVSSVRTTHSSADQSSGSTEKQQMVDLRVINESSLRIEESWIDKDGKEHPWGTSEPRSVTDLKSSAPISWRFYHSENKKLLGQFLTGSKSQRLTFDQDGLLKVTALKRRPARVEQAAIALHFAEHRAFPAPYGHGIGLQWTKPEVKELAHYEIQFSEDAGHTWTVYSKDRPWAWINHHGEDRCKVSRRWLGEGHHRYESATSPRFSATQCLGSGKQFTYRVRGLDARGGAVTRWSNRIIATMPRWDTSVPELQLHSNMKHYLASVRSMKSLQDTTVSALEINNNREQAVHLYWIDYDGLEQFHARIEAGERLKQLTYLTHHWRFRDAQTKQILKSIVSDERQKAVTLAPPH